MAYRCEDCELTYDEASAEHVADLCRELARDIAAELEAQGSGVATRPAPDVWSSLEYACHVRDVLLVQRERVLLARRVDEPAPEPMGRDERVDHDGYAEQRVVDVVRQLLDAADLFANVLDRLDADAWSRTIRYTYPPPARSRPLRWVAVHTRHELQHHLHDIRRQR